MAVLDPKSRYGVSAALKLHAENDLGAGDPGCGPAPGVVRQNASVLKALSIRSLRRETTSLIESRLPAKGLELPSYCLTTGHDAGRVSGGEKL
jgi:hypothetical protein